MRGLPTEKGSFDRLLNLFFVNFKMFKKFFMLKKGLFGIFLFTILPPAFSALKKPAFGTPIERPY
jgi:hypothetical protein